MQNLPPSDQTTATSWRGPAPIPYERHGFSWSAVAAGVVVAIGLTVLFAQAGLAIQLRVIDGESSIRSITMTSAIGSIVAGLVALFAGAWVAGRMATTRSSQEGGLHGAAVWGAASIASLLLAFSVVGAVGGGMVTLVAQGLKGAGEAVAAAAPDWDEIRDELSAGADRLTGDRGEGAAGREASETRFIESSRTLELAGRHFDLDGGSLSASEREELVGLMAKQLDISPAVAEQTLEQWTSVWQDGVARYEELTARTAEMADQVRSTAATAAGWAAFGMLLGAVVAVFAGAFGTLCRVRDLPDHEAHDSLRPFAGKRGLQGGPSGTSTPHDVRDPVAGTRV